MATNTPNDINRAIQAHLDRAAWRTTLTRDYNDTANRLDRVYQNLVPNMRDALDRFTGRLDSYAAANEGATPTPDEVRGWREFQRLLTSVEGEMNAFSGAVESETASLANGAVQTGIDAAEDLFNAAGGAQITISAFNRPDPAAIAQAIAYTESEAFKASIAGFGEAAAENFGDVIVAGIAQGKHPSVIARIAANWLQVPRSWAENTARTTQLWSYRQASHDTYRANSDVIMGWQWWATLDDRVCLSCLSQHGSTHTLAEHLDGHHRCRCAPIPVVIGSTWQNSVTTGAQWFDEQPEATQRSIMGAGRYELYRSGMFDWNRASRHYHNDIFGLMRRESTLRELT